MSAEVIADVQHVSPRKLAQGLIVALLGAAVVLFVFVLPAEYGVDPTGLGRATGLNDLGDAKRIAANVRQGAPMHAHPRKHRSARVTIQLAGREELEYKAVLEQGEPLLYSWTVAEGEVYSEFHGDPTTGEWPQDYFQSYEIKERTAAEHGSFVAPFTGRHGWYWRNLSERPAAITLEVSGYYSKIGRLEGGGAAVE